MIQLFLLSLDFPVSSILFPAQISLLFDSLDIIISLTSQIFKTWSPRIAASTKSNPSSSTPLLGNSPVHSVADQSQKKYPKAFAVLFIVTLLQAIKIWGI